MMKIITGTATLNRTIQELKYGHMLSSEKVYQTLNRTIQELKSGISTTPLSSHSFSQSHHTGIEIKIMSLLVKSSFTLNRTIQELKGKSFNNGFSLDSALNRTIQELKFKRHSVRRNYKITLNRTIQELKCFYRYFYYF